MVRRPRSIASQPSGGEPFASGFGGFNGLYYNIDSTDVLNPHQPRLAVAQAAVGQKSNSLAVMRRYVAALLLGNGIAVGTDQQ